MAPPHRHSYSTSTSSWGQGHACSTQDEESRRPSWAVAWEEATMQRRRLHGCWQRTQRRRRWQTCSVEFTSYRSSSSRVARSLAPMESKLSSASASISKSKAREESTYTASEHLPDPVSRLRPERVRAPWRRSHAPSTLMRCPLLAFSVAARLPPLASCCRSRSPLTHRLLHYSKVISSDFDGRVRRTCQPRR
jgi:hypothetical protein